MQDQQTKEHYHQMLIEQIKAATQEPAEESSKKQKGLKASFIPHFNLSDLTKQFEVPHSPAITLESLNSEIKILKKQVEYLYSIQSQPSTPKDPFPEKFKFSTQKKPSEKTPFVYIPINPNFSLKPETSCQSFPTSPKRELSPILPLEESLGDMTLNSISITDEQISYIIRIPGLIYEKQKPTSIKKYKALVDSGARMNIINPILVPHNCTEPSTLAAISTTTDRVDTPWQCTMKLYLSKDKWIIITAVLFKIDHGMILGSPFLARLWPNGLTRQKGKFSHHFTIHDESIFFPFIMKNEPSVLHRIEAIQEHLGEI